MTGSTDRSDTAGNAPDADADADVVRRYVERLSAADRSGAVAVATSFIGEGRSFDDLLEQLIGPAQEIVGQRWQANEWTVAQEHAATAISEHVVSRLAERVHPERSAGQVVVTCVEGEWHSLAARGLAAAFEAAGWDAVTLGPSAPATHVGVYLNDVGPDALALTCSVPMNLPGARRLIEVGRRSGLPVLVGGRAFGPDDRRARTLGASVWAPTMGVAAAALESIDRFVSPAPPLDHPGATEHVRLEVEIARLVPELLEILKDRVQLVRDSDDVTLDQAREHIFFTLRFVSAALLCDDPTIVDDYVTWLVETLGARRVEESVVRRAIGAMAEHVGRPLPAAGAMLAANV